MLSHFTLPSPEQLQLEASRKQVLFQGKLARFKPSFGARAIWIERYLQLTRSMLNYFKGEPVLRGLASSRNVEVHLEKPLLRIPIGQIRRAAQLGDDERQAIVNDGEEREKSTLFLFEIELKDDYESLYLLNHNFEALTGELMSDSRLSRPSGKRAKKTRLTGIARMETQIKHNLSRMKMWSKSAASLKPVI